VKAEEDMPKVRDIMTVGVRTADPETACFRYGDIAVKHKNERLGGQALETSPRE
jgi:hypothetical protein